MQIYMLEFGNYIFLLSFSFVSNKFINWASLVFLLLDDSILYFSMTNTFMLFSVWPGKLKCSPVGNMSCSAHLTYPTETVLESGTCLTNVFNKFKGRFVTRSTIINIVGFTGNRVRYIYNNLLIIIAAPQFTLYYVCTGATSWLIAFLKAWYGPLAMCW